MDYNCTANAEEIKAAHINDELEDVEFEGAEGYESLIEYQMDSSNFETICFFLLFPLRFFMHFTIPDVRMLNENGEPTATIGKAYLSTLSCLLWLIIGSYAMVSSLEALGELLGVSDAIMGFTVSAAGKWTMTILLGPNNDLFVLKSMLNILFAFTFFRYITSQLCCIKSCSGKGVRKSSCVECIRFEYFQHHVWSRSSLDALYQSWKQF
jgi:hypothetical protein